MAGIVAPTTKPVHPRKFFPHISAGKAIIKFFVTLAHVKGSLKYLSVYHDILNERAG
jgi:hypothetical protein